MVLAKESQHWYDRQGNPVYEVPRADGKGVRQATLADARKLNLSPGVTGIISVAARPGLERWRREQTLLSALTLPRKEGEAEAVWIKRVFEDSEEQARKAAEKGTKIHAEIEKHYRGEYIDAQYADFVRGVLIAVGEKYTVLDWLSEKSFVSEYGYGCKIDLKAPGLTGDIKTKEFSDPANKLAWPEHAMQLASNRIAANDPTSKCFNIFVSTSVPGLVHIHEWTEEELDRAWRKFKALLDYWQADRNYKPVW